jgi:hypothetical protein
MGEITAILPATEQSREPENPKRFYFPGWKIAYNCALNGGG